MIAPGWPERVGQAIVARTAEPRWCDPLWLRVSDAAGEVLVRAFPGTRSAPQLSPRSDRVSSGLLDRIPFRIASVTKVYVAAAVFRLVEENALELEAALPAVADEATTRLLAATGYDGRAITVAQLLRHTAGIADHSASEAFLRRVVDEPLHRWTRQEQIGIAMALGPPLGRPGARFAYSDTGYLLLGDIVERASGKPLHAALRDLLGFDRLGLGSTWFDGAEPDPPGQPPRAHQYHAGIDTTEFDASIDAFGGGGLVSTLHDLDRFWRALFEGDVFRDPRTLAGLFADAGTPCGFDGFRHNGLAFRNAIAGTDSWGHTGFWGVLAAYLPEHRAAVTATFNRSRRDGCYDADALLFDVVGALLAAPPA